MPLSAAGTSRKIGFCVLLAASIRKRNGNMGEAGFNCAGLNCILCLSSGHMVPGFFHAVSRILRLQDPVDRNQQQVVRSYLHGATAVARSRYQPDWQLFVTESRNAISIG
jgi:hypothetical protein